MERQKRHMWLQPHEVGIISETNEKKITITERNNKQIKALTIYSARVVITFIMQEQSFAGPPSSTAWSHLMNIVYKEDAYSKDLNAQKILFFPLTLLFSPSLCCSMPFRTWLKTHNKTFVSNKTIKHLCQTKLESTSFRETCTSTILC